MLEMALIVQANVNTAHQSATNVLIVSVQYIGEWDEGKRKEMREWTEIRMFKWRKMDEDCVDKDQKPNTDEEYDYDTDEDYYCVNIIIQ